MEFLLGNPFSTPAGHCIERATDGSLQSEDWTLNMEICDIINETEDGPKDAIKAMKKRLNGNRNYREVMLALMVLETCVKNCGHRFHSLVTSRDFIDGVLVKIIAPKNNPPTIVQDKVLALVQAWADAFRSSPDLTGVVQIYEELKRKGVEFPMSQLETLSPIHTPQRVASAPEGDSALHHYSAPPTQTPAPPPAHAIPPVYTTLQAQASITQQGPGSITPTPEQICRLRSELDIVRGNTKVMSEMLTEMLPGQEESSDHQLLQELHRTCRAMQQRVVELISCVSNEEVTEELLHVNDDLNNIFLRYERYERCRLGKFAAQSVDNGLSQVLSEATEDNLIDLGPGSPAVVSNIPSVAPAGRPSSLLASAGPPSSPASLASRLAGLDVGADSVSCTLSSLNSSQPHPAHDDFDMFAQTRTTGAQSADPRPTALSADPRHGGPPTDPGPEGPPAEPHRTSAVEDSSLSVPTLEVRQPSAGGKGDEGEEGVTSEEFDKFLEERAKAAEMAPSLPSPPIGDLSAPQGTPSRRAVDRSEGNLFAM